MRQPDTCGTCNRPYVRIQARQPVGGPCPRCKRIAANRDLRERRADAGICTSCGQRPAQEGRRQCRECVKVRTRTRA